MQLTIEALRREDGRVALFLADRFVGHASPAFAELLRSGAPGHALPSHMRADTVTTPATSPAILRRHPVKKAATRVSEKTGGGVTRNKSAALTELLVRAQQLADEGQSLAAIARAVGRTESCLYLWKKQGKLRLGGVVKASTKGPARRGSRPPKTTGPTLATLDVGEDAPEAGPKQCPVCEAWTDERYCPNGHDIYLDAGLDDD